MTRIKFIALFVAIVGTGLYIYSYFNPPQTWERLNQKGISAFKASRYEEAEKYLIQALELAEVVPLNDRRLYFSLYQLAEIFRIESKFDEADVLLKRILEIDTTKYGREHQNVAFALNNLAVNSRMRGQYGEAEALLKQALDILERSLGKDHPLVGNILEHYAYLLRQMGRSVEAEKLERRYQEIFSKQTMNN
jgi:tetratricopeptide (TPR) repeat protein